MGRIVFNIIPDIAIVVFITYDVVVVPSLPNIETYIMINITF